MSTPAHTDAVGNSALDDLLPRVYEELRRIAARHMQQERVGHTLQPTALVHEAFVRLAELREINWRDRGHFLSVASSVIRRVLIDHARNHRAAKRGGDGTRIRIGDLDELSTKVGVDLVALDEVLERLRQLSERQYRVVELRFFGGLSLEQIAEVLAVSPRTVDGDWAVARAWLDRQLNG